MRVPTRSDRIPGFNADPSQRPNPIRNTFSKLALFRPYRRLRDASHRQRYGTAGLGIPSPSGPPEARLSLPLSPFPLTCILPLFTPLPQNKTPTDEPHRAGSPPPSMASPSQSRIETSGNVSARWKAASKPSSSTQKTRPTSGSPFSSATDW